MRPYLIWSQPKARPHRSSGGGLSVGGDFITLTEFSELTGPEMCYHEGKLPEGFDRDSWALKCMGVDFRKRQPRECFPQPNCFDMQSIWKDREFHVFSHNFAVPDFFGRGYTRTASFAYVSRVPNKLTRIVKSLRKAFSKAALELKREGQKVFLRNIGNCLDWLECELSKFDGQTDVEAKSLPTSNRKDRVDLEIYKRYFQMDLDRLTLNDIKADMLEIRNLFSERIRELKSSYSWVKQSTFRPKGSRPRHRPQCRKRELRSLMKVLDKFSIRSMKLRMQQILAQFRGSALDIWIERKTQRRVNSKELVFNIGSLCQMPISISKYVLPRQKYLNSKYQPMDKLRSSLADRHRLYDKTSYQTYSSNSEWLNEVGDTGLNPSPYKTHVLEEPTRNQHISKSSQEKKSSGETLGNELLSIDNDEEVLSPDTYESPVKWSYEVGSNMLAQIPTWFSGRLGKHAFIPCRASPEWKSGKSSNLQIHSKLDDFEREFCSASSSIPKSNKDILDMKMPDLSLGEPASVRQGNQSGNDSPISLSSFGSRGSITKVPCKTSQQDLDNLLSKLLLDECRRFAEEILYTIFIGRPLLLVASNKNVKKVIRCARAVSMLVPGADHRSIQLLRTEPLTVQQLSDLKVVAISEGAFKATSPCVLSWCSYFDLDELNLSAPHYKKRNSNQWLTMLLNQMSYQTSSQSRRFLQTKLAQMQLSAYLYYWRLIIGIRKAPLNGGKTSYSGPFLRERQIPKSEREKHIKQIGISDKRDFAILEHWARIIERRVERAETLRVSSHCFPPEKRDEKSCRKNKEGMRDCLLRQYSDKPTILHISPLRA